MEESLFGKKFTIDLIQKNYIPAESRPFQPQYRMELLNTLVRNFPRLVIPRDPDHPETIRHTNDLIHELSGVIYGQTKTGMRTYETVTAHDDMVMALGLSIVAASKFQPITCEESTTRVIREDDWKRDSLSFDTSSIFGERIKPLDL